MMGNTKIRILHSASGRTVCTRSGFTLVEMLAVILIIAVMMGVVSSAVASARRSAMRTHTRDVARQLVVAWTAYLNDQGSFPAKSKFHDGVDGNAYYASAYNIGALLNTQYYADGRTPIADSITYFETSKDECDRTVSGNAVSCAGSGVKDKWGGVLRFVLDFALDGRIENPVHGGWANGAALVYSTAGYDFDGSPAKYAKKCIVAY